ncbi:MAG: GrpB family protein [Candidatus Izemoplasma sp.]
MRKQLKVKKYNPEWAYEFDVIKKVYLRFLSKLDLEILHVGSTSIKDCYAKPIIDIDVVLKNFSDFAEIKELFISLGYIHEGNKGIKDREVFTRKTERVPLFSSNTYKFCHHVYVLPVDSLPLKNHLLFKDYLLAHPQEIEVYGNLKLDSLRKGLTREKYAINKTEYIMGILKKAGLSEFHLELIRKENT